MIQSWKWIARCMAVCLILGVSTEALAVTVKTTDSPFRPDIRALGMGGAYIAAGKNGGAFHYNPALLTQTTTDIAIPISIGFDQNAANVFNFINDNSDDLENFNDLSVADQDRLYNDLTPFDGERIRVRVTPMFNIVTKNLGLAAYGIVRVGAGVDKGIFEPRVEAGGVADVVVMLGMAKKTSEKMAFGINAKIVNRRSTDFRVGVTKLEDVADSVVDSLKNGKTGIALDLGMLYNLSERTNLGFVIQDLYGKVGNQRFPVNVKAGIATTPMRRFTFALDVTDLLNQDGISLFSRVYMGGEFRIPFVSARAGFYQGYPTLGAGLNLKILKFDYAFYRREFGRRPGLEGRSQHEFQVKLGWGW